MCKNKYEYFLTEMHDKIIHNPKICLELSGVRRKFSWGCFIQWHMVVICLWFVVFVTSQFYVIIMSRNQRFGEVC